MKHKKIFYILTVSLYIVILLLSLSFLFSVKEVKRNYSMVTGSERYLQLEKQLDGYENKNLLFLNTMKIKNKLEADPYIVVKSIKKKYPNKLVVDIEERREMFVLETQNEKYLLDDNYFVLKKVDKQSQNENIELVLNYAEFDFSQLVVGKEIKAINDDIIVCVNEMLAIFSDWKNILKGIEVEQVFGEATNFRVCFYTNQGVVIEIRKALDEGVKKAQSAYDRYCELSDFEKTSGRILSYKNLTNGTIVVDYTLSDLSEGGENA